MSKIFLRKCYYFYICNVEIYQYIYRVPTLLSSHVVTTRLVMVIYDFLQFDKYKIESMQKFSTKSIVFSSKIGIKIQYSTFFSKTPAISNRKGNILTYDITTQFS